MKIVSASFIAALAIACTTTNPAATKPGTDSDPSCEPGEILGCGDDDTLRVCDETGSVITEACSAGCNAEANRCNECTPDALACQGDNVLERCGSDGLVASTETCSLQCADDPSSGAHCTHIVPAFMPEVCDTPAVLPELDISIRMTIDTDDDMQCTGGVIAQTSGPEICVVRYGTIRIDTTVKVTGRRAIAFVADHSLDVVGVLDVSADTKISGPGGGFVISGAAPGRGGGGGAGFRTHGARGGGDEFGNNAGAGGTMVNPLTLPAFGGGTRAGSSTSPTASYNPAGGGAGGGLLLVSCFGKVSVPGLIDAGGGGGGGGGDTITSYTGTALVGGAGGGAGGYVVLQGAEVSVDGGHFYANGGGGGSGCTLDNCVGNHGEDGGWNTGSRGGAVPPNSGGGAGGMGAIGSNAPTFGANSTTSSPGGGGGSTGRFQIFTPAGVAPVLTPTLAQPAFESSLEVATK